jgi:hypothetical protein
VAQVVCVGEAYLAAQVLELLVRNACTTDTYVLMNGDERTVVMVGVEMYLSWCLVCRPA